MFWIAIAILALVALLTGPVTPQGERFRAQAVSEARCPDDPGPPRRQPPEPMIRRWRDGMAREPSDPTCIQPSPTV